MNEILKRFPFKAGEREAEVRVWFDGDGFVVQSFADSRAVSLAFGVSLDQARDLATERGLSAVEGLVDLARNDAINILGSHKTDGV